MTTDPTEAARNTKLAFAVMAGSPTPIAENHKTPIQKAEPRTPLPQQVQIRIDEVLVKLEDNGAREATLEGVRKDLEKFARAVNIDSPEEVKHFISKLKVSEAYKARLCTSYGAYCKAYKLFWEKPHYNRESKSFKVPTTERVNQIIVGCHTRKLALMLQISKYGLRPIEVVNLTPENFDFDLNTIMPQTAKRGAARTIKVEQMLSEAIKRYITEKKIKPNQRLFPIKVKSYSYEFRRVRNRIANNANDPSIKRIRLYDFRHYFGTLVFSKTQSVAFTANQLGHRNWKNTKVYVDLDAVLKQC